MPASSNATVSLTEGPVVLGNGIAGETLRIPTADPSGFHQAISEPDAMPTTEILGSLFLPPGEGPWPVVIVVPGSLGVAPSHVAKAGPADGSRDRLLRDRPVRHARRDLHRRQPGALVLVRSQRLGRARGRGGAG